ncbi:Transthyretin [Terfezia boudieri ATCC MYA-4762]|uniref:Transthyretin n=1 Tax=Terfezia boudieri ATCC MYA-4762 TaxID=1051890 RepID=A0A3N4L8C9_9PEZI|nr:Transthyretin [Terfezia boudieri ATCC MYA-4762]
MSPPWAPTERLKQLSNHLSYTKTTTTTTTTTHDPSSSSSPPDPSYTFIGTPLPRHALTNFKPALSTHNPSSSASTTSPASASTMAAPPRPAITCHVLDTTLGRPGSSIPVTLMSLPSPSSFTTPYSTSAPTIIATGLTDSDGRVSTWNFTPIPGQDEEGSRCSISTARGRIYMLRLETEGYFQRWYDVVFKMGGGDILGEDGRDEGERKHYHVPVLLSRFGYTTYRGS